MRDLHIRAHTYTRHTYTSVVLLGARYGGFIPKGYVAIVFARIAATMAGYSSALNTDFAPESARRMQRSAIDAIGDARESSGCAITRYIPYVLRSSYDTMELVNWLISHLSREIYDENLSTKTNTHLLVCESSLWSNAKNTLFKLYTFK